MVKHSTFSVIFVLRAKKNSKVKKEKLYARITVDGQRVELSLGRNISTGLFDQKAQRCTGNKTEARQINDFLSVVYSNLNEIRKELILEGKDITAEFIKTRYKGLPDPDQVIYPNLLELYEDHNRKFKELVGRKGHSASTYKRHLTSIGHAKDFIKETYEKEDLPFEQINFKFLHDYEHYLKAVRKCNHNSTMKYIKNLGKIINLAYAEGYLKQNPFDKFKLTYEKVHREALTEYEIERIQNLNLEDERLEKVRDLFLFCIYTGLAFIDVQHLKMDHLYQNKNGDWWIKNNRYKTSAEFLIPLLPVPLKLMNKYNDHPVRTENGKVIPTLSNQKYNSYLKEIASRAKIRKSLTSHIARHTFATTIGLENGIPLEVVAKMLGHTNTRTTLEYAKVNEKAILNGMKNLITIKKEKKTRKYKKV